MDDCPLEEPRTIFYAESCPKGTLLSCFALEFHSQNGWNNVELLIPVCFGPAEAISVPLWRENIHTNLRSGNNRRRIEKSWKNEDRSVCAHITEFDAKKRRRSEDRRLKKRLSG